MQVQLLAQKTCHTMYRSLRSIHPFLHKNPTLYNAFQLDDTLKVPLRVGHLHFHIIHVPWNTRLSTLNYNSNGSAIFTQPTAESPYNLQCALKCD